MDLPRARPTADESERVVDVDSLEDLVDVAIDSDRRVIEDAESGDFVVFDGATRYRFRNGAEPKPTDADDDRVSTAREASLDPITGDGSDSTDTTGHDTSAGGEGSDW